MPTKFKPDNYRYEGHGVARKQILEKSYIKGASKDELFEYINNPSSKSKIKQKCVNELTRRGIKLTWTYADQPNISNIVGKLR